MNNTIALSKAVAYEWLTIIWTVVVGIAALWAGTILHGISLAAFGADSLVECVCAGVLLRRLNLELKAGWKPDSGEERRAARIVGSLLLLAAAYITAYALWNLIQHHRPERDLFGILLTTFSIPIMVLLANGKLTIARAIQSRALRADAIGNVVCWYLAAMVLLSIILDWRFGLWWVDGAASIAIVALLVYEGCQAWRASPID